MKNKKGFVLVVAEVAVIGVLLVGGTIMHFTHGWGPQETTVDTVENPAPSHWVGEGNKGVGVGGNF